MQFSTLRRLFPLVLAFVLAACGGGIEPDPPHDPSDPGGPGGPVDPGDPQSQASIYYVDAAVGSDANDGTSDRPFRTITHAVFVSEEGDTIRVRAGTYDKALGEHFPLFVPTGVTLSGNGILKGRGIVISGAGLHQWPGGAVYATIVPGPNSLVSGVGLYNYEDNIEVIGGIVARNTVVAAVRSDFSVRNCTIRSQAASSSGVRFANGSTGITVDSCDIRGAGQGVIFLDGGGEGSLIQGTTLQENGIGVMYFGDSMGADLGGGAAGSYGGNTISENTGYDLVAFGTSLSVDAQNCLWDGCSGPSVYTGSASPPAGTDIWIGVGNNVDLTGARPDDFCLDR